MNIFSGVDLLARGVNASWKRNKIIQNNIANVDTPDFKASEIQFERFFEDAIRNGADDFGLKRTRRTHMVIGSEFDSVDGMVTTSQTTERMDGNNVDIDKETTDFAKNVIYYNTLTQKVNGQFSQLRMAIRGQ
ncbi:MAG: flagellar basal body rod protein FlgB [Christensenellaceae bacterium]|jgi:flagellar basal-body rod protein FlgB